jgi:hypothetical protein
VPLRDGAVLAPACFLIFLILKVLEGAGVCVHVHLASVNARGEKDGERWTLWDGMAKLSKTGGFGKWNATADALLTR